MADPSAPINSVQLILSGAIGFGSACIGAWLNPKFAYLGFRRQKTFERKLEVYDEVFRHIHAIRHWAGIRIQEVESGTDSEQSYETVRSSFNESRAILSSTAAKSAWMFPDEFQDVIKKINDQVFNGAATGESRYFRNAIPATEAGRRELLLVARKDMGINTAARWEKFRAPRP